MRKFAHITLLETKDLEKIHFKDTGPEPLEKTFTVKKFIDRLERRPHGKIKQVLMDQTIIAGIGNIYSDEMLWLSGIHPLRTVEKITQSEFNKLYKGMRDVLHKGIDFKGDSTSDYRQLDGRPGNFNHHHNAYRLTGKKCAKRGCTGIIKRIIVGGRSAHFCSKHQT
jgi:formamidopyrimidine-DNA glycosylase